MTIHPGAVRKSADSVLRFTDNIQGALVA